MSDIFEPDSSASVTRSKGSRQRPSKKKGIAGLFTWKWFTIVMIATLLLIVTVCSAIMAYGEVVDLKKIERIGSSSYMTDINGKKVAVIGNTQREYLPLKEIAAKNQLLIDAIVKVEDVRFFQHGGVDFWSMGRALWANISRKRQEGGGTITMQVSRNVILENKDISYTRKLKEIGTAWNAERRYTKNEILQAYLNFIDFGPNISGVQMASKVYFNKDLTKDRLDPSEVALLAGLPKAPGRYYPFGNSENQKQAKQRRAVVLDVMAKNSEMRPLITESEKAVANADPLFKTREGKKHLRKSTRFDAYKQLVLAELKNRYNIDSATLKSRQYKVSTGLDTEVQIKTDEALSILKPYSRIEGGTATIDVKSKLITAIGGGKNFQPGDLVQGAYELKPTGSSIKPLTVFSPAIEDCGMNAYSTVQDRDLNFGGWHPKNWDGKEHGPIPFLEAVKRSWNLGTLWILKEKVKLSRAAEYGTKLGLKFSENDKTYATLGLGGFQEGGATPLQMARAYSVFPNQGTKIHAYAINKVECLDDRESKEIQPIDQAEDVSIFKPTTAYQMTSMLKEVINSGTGTNARLGLGRPVAGKSGTTNNNKEAWFVGYTTRYVTAVMTYSTESVSRGSKRELVRGALSQNIFRQIMDQAMAGKPYEDFPRPPGAIDLLPPIAVVPPQVQGAYVSGSNVINLTWQKQDPRIRYEIYRSVDGKIVNLPNGSVSYTDRIDPATVPHSSIDYIVTAIDDTASDPAMKRKSTSITIPLLRRDLPIDRGRDNHHRMPPRGDDGDGPLMPLPPRRAPVPPVDGAAPLPPPGRNGGLGL